MKKLIEPTEEQIDETWREIEQMAKKDLNVRRKLNFSLREDTFYDENGKQFVKRDGKMYPVGDL